MVNLAALRDVPRKASPNPANLSSPSVATSAGCNGTSYGSVSLVLRMRYVVVSLADAVGACVLLRSGVRIFSVTTALRSGIPGRREVSSSEGDIVSYPTLSNDIGQLSNRSARIFKRISYPTVSKQR